MRIMRIANGVRHLEEADDNVTMYRIREVLSEHRSNLIIGILSDLPTYIQFKFYTNVDKDIRGSITQKLVEFAATKVSLTRYADVVRQIKQSNNYRVPTHEFFEEIDLFLEGQLNPAQLQLI